MSDKGFTARLRKALARLIRMGLDDGQIAAQCHALGSDLCMELGICPISEGDLIGVIRGLMTGRPARVKTGVAEIDSLSEAQARWILAEAFRFMYQHEDGTWDPDKEIPGAELVSLLCGEMPEPGRRGRAPDLAGQLVSRLEAGNVPDSALDDLVHDLAGGLGSSVNNEGFLGQVRFILDQLGEKPGRREIEKVVERHAAGSGGPKRSRKGQP